MGRINELDTFKNKMEPLTINLTQDITALKGEGELAVDKLEELKAYSNKLEEAIKTIQDNEKKTVKELDEVKDDSETLGEKIEDLHDKLEKLSVNTSEFKSFNTLV